MKGPLASVIVPVFNGERFLGACLESVLAQDYEPVEVVVVDDASTDGTVDVAASFPGVHVVRLPVNGGPAAARNAGLERANGDFIAFFDHDDVMLPTKLSAQIGYLLEHPEVDCTLARQEIFLEPGTEFPDWLQPDRLFDELGGIQPLSAVVRRAAAERVGAFDASYRIADDMDWLLRVRAEGFAIEVLPDVVMRRRVHGTNLTYQMSVIRQEMLRIMRARVVEKREPRPSTG